MILNVYADPVQGITISVVKEVDNVPVGAEAVSCTKEDYLNEVIAMVTVYGKNLDGIRIDGHEAYAAKIADEIRQEFPQMDIMYAWADEETE